MSDHVVTYNEYTFKFPQVKHREEVQYAPDGYTQIGVQHLVEISGWIQSNTVGEHMAEKTRMECMLMSPRKVLQIGWNTTANYLKIYPAVQGMTPVEARYGQYVDTKNGPTPISLTFGRTLNGIATEYTFRLVANIKDCLACSSGAYVATNNRILSLVRRWDHSIDINGLTTRTLSGALTVTSQASVGGEYADMWRSYVMPDLPKGWHRTGMRFSQSEDARTLAFTVSDVEVNSTLPRPVTAGQVSFSVHTNEKGANAVFSLSGWIEGSKYTDKSTLFSIILSMVRSRIPSSKRGAISKMLGADISEDVFGKRLTFSMQVLGPSDAANRPIYISQEDNILFVIGNLNQPIVGSDNKPLSTGIANYPWPYGGTQADNTYSAPDGNDIPHNNPQNSGVAALPIYGVDACTSLQTSPPTTTPTYEAPKPARPGTETTPTNDPTVVNGNDYTSAFHQTNLVTEYNETISYETDHGIAPLYPKASGYPPVMQQARQAVMHIIQTGFIVFHTDRLQTDLSYIVPDPVDSSATMLRHSVTPKNPTPLSGGLVEHTIHWQYVMATPLDNVTNGYKHSETVFPIPNDARIRVEDNQTYPAWNLTTPVV